MNVLVIAKTLVPPICFAADLSRLRRSRVPNWGLSWNFGTGKLGQLGLVMVTIPKWHQRLSILYDIYCLMLWAIEEALVLQSPKSPSQWDAYFDLCWRILRQPWATTRQRTGFSG